MLDPLNANKIPYGRLQCDRRLANQKFEYHMTVAHWSQQDDPIYLPRVPLIAFPAFSMAVTKSEICPAQEDSWILCFPLQPGDRYAEALDLYHIWAPVRKVCRLYCLDGC